MPLISTCDNTLFRAEHGGDVQAAGQLGEGSAAGAALVRNDLIPYLFRAEHGGNVQAAGQLGEGSATGAALLLVTRQRPSSSSGYPFH